MWISQQTITNNNQIENNTCFDKMCGVKNNFKIFLNKIIGLRSCLIVNTVCTFLCAQNYH